MKQKFIKAVETGDVVSVRFFISNEMMLDPRGASCLEMIQFAEEHLADLYEKEDENTYSYSETELTNDYLNKVKNDLDFCFTKKLLLFYIEVAMIVLKDKANDIAREEEQKLFRQDQREQSGTSRIGRNFENQAEDNSILDAFERFYHSKGFWPTIGAIGAALVYLLLHYNGGNQK